MAISIQGRSHSGAIQPAGSHSTGQVRTLHAYAPKTSFSSGIFFCDRRLNFVAQWLRRAVQKGFPSGALQAGFAVLLVSCVASWLIAQPASHTFSHPSMLGGNGGFLLLWPVSGMGIGWSLRFWRTGVARRCAPLGAMLCAVLLGTLAGSQNAALASTWTVLTCVDILLAGSFLGPHIASFEDLKRRANIVRLVLAATVVPVISGVAITLPVALFHHVPWLQATSTAILANSLGIVIALPAVLFLTTGEYRSLRKLAPHLRSAAGACMLFLAVTGLTFWQQKGPFLFVIFPPLMLVLLLLGLEGAVFGSVALSAIGWFATAHGHGPIWLMQGASLEVHLMVLQCFVWVCLTTALPVGALLDERRRAERGAQEAQEIYTLLLQHTNDAIVLRSLDGKRLYASPTIEQMTGWSPAEYLAMPRQQTLHPEDRDLVALVDQSLRDHKREQTIRCRTLHKDGNWRWIEATVRSYGGDQLLGYVATFRDISAQQQTETAWQAERRAMAQEKQSMAALASTDPLTLLLNRRGLEDGLRQHRFSTAAIAVLMIDIDFFKQFNDTYGHAAGDRCLTLLGATIRRQAARKGDLVARLGGEEFTVVLPNADAAGGVSVAEAICRELQNLALEHGNSPLGFVSVSIGVTARQGEEDVDFNLLLAQADRALYASKHEGRNRVTLFQPSPAEGAPIPPPRHDDRIAAFRGRHAPTVQLPPNCNPCRTLVA